MKGYFQNVSSVLNRPCFFHESLESVRKIEVCFEGVLREFQGYSKEVYRVFQETFMGDSRVFQEYFKKVIGSFK